MEGSIMRVECRVIKGSSKFTEGDLADCSGPVKYDWIIIYSAKI